MHDLDAYIASISFQLLLAAAFMNFVIFLVICN